MTYTYTKQIPLRHEVDVFVAGGGPAGIAAAVTAARHGKSVFICDSQGSFGGSGTHSLVPAFMPFTNGVDFLAGGVGREVYDDIISMKAVADGFDEKKRFYNGSVSILAEDLKLIYDRMMKSSGADFTFFTTLIDAVCDAEGHIDHVVLSAKSGIFAVKAKQYIDCTGDGDLCALAGAPFERGDPVEHLCMPSTLCQLWSGIDFSRRKGPDSRELERAFADGVFTNEDRHLPGMWRLSDTLGGGNIGHSFGVDSTDERSLTDGMLHGREIAREYEKYYKEYLTGFEKMELCATGSTLGVRESRRITGDYVMSFDDFKSRASFDDEIGRFSYPVDIHIMKPTKADYDNFASAHTTQRYKSGESYGIPYRILLPKTLSNCLVAGRCVSTDREMQSSIRVMPACYITGQAAGLAASIAVANGSDTRSVKYSELRDGLLGIGAYLG